MDVVITIATTKQLMTMGCPLCGHWPHSVGPRCTCIQCRKVEAKRNLLPWAHLTQVQLPNSLALPSKVKGNNEEQAKVLEAGFLGKQRHLVTDSWLPWLSGWGLPQGGMSPSLGLWACHGEGKERSRSNQSLKCLRSYGKLLSMGQIRLVLAIQVVWSLAAFALQGQS